MKVIYIKDEPIQIVTVVNVDDNKEDNSGYVILGIWLLVFFIAFTVGQVEDFIYDYNHKDIPVYVAPKNIFTLKQYTENDNIELNISFESSIKETPETYKDSSHFNVKSAPPYITKVEGYINGELWATDTEWELSNDNSTYFDY